RGEGLAQSRQALRKCPQVLINVRFGGGVKPLEHPAVKEACARVTEAMQGRGRVLLRKSGTEQLIRVMAEAADEESAAAQVDAIIAAMKAAGVA
ncbi:MAG: hypothetical protein IKF96_08305, partial [Eggerthellaceae bacterium]|nr:hypothetical protein [Eggerthellaceae bacterium]